MKAIFLLSLFIFGLSCSLAKEACDCHITSQFYKDLKCKPIFEDETKCCPTKYDCSQVIDNRDKTKCYFNGKSYKDRETIHDDGLEGSCRVGCFCSEGEFVCASVDCPWPTIKPECKARYFADKCCPSGIICPPFDKCTVDGVDYEEGDYFTPKDHPDLTCKCNKGFTGKFEKPYCVTKLPTMEIGHAGDINRYCAPVFLKYKDGEIGSQPHEYLCDAIPDNVAVKTIPEGKDSCKFKDQYIPKGVEFEVAKVINSYTTFRTTCDCSLPPYTSCVLEHVYDLENMPPHLRKHHE